MDRKQPERPSSHSGQAIKNLGKPLLPLVFQLFGLFARFWRNAVA